MGIRNHNLSLVVLVLLLGVSSAWGAQISELSREVSSFLPVVQMMCFALLYPPVRNNQ